MDVYEKLREILDTHPVGAPKSLVFDRFLRMLFKPEEVSILLHMNFALKPVEVIAEVAGIPVEEADQILGAMADRVLVLSRDKDGKHFYALLPVIPGLYEFPFMRGKMTSELLELAKLRDDYHRDGLGASFAGTPTSLVRVIPVEKSIDATLRVHPYEEVKNIINSAEFIGLGQCACRVTNNNCDNPTETCLFFNAPARFLVEKKCARQITREEAQTVLERAEKEGLVHTSTNSADTPYFLCNCCKCCCILLKGKTELNLSHHFAPSGFQAEVKAGDCIGCNICVEERCPMGAIEMKEDTAFVTEGKCIGCGLCVTACPAESIVLVRRNDPTEVPATTQDLVGKVLVEKGKLQKFKKLMKS